MEIADHELIAEFVVESQEGLANIENQMLAIESRGADIDVDLVNSVFRTMHSIKGAAGFLGLDRIGSLAHGLEEVLNNLRNREMTPTPELVTCVLRAADYMKGLIDEVDNSNDADVAPYLASLNQFRPETPDSAAERFDATSTDHAPDAIQANARAPMSDAVREFLIECYENLDQMDRDLLALEQHPTAENLLRSVFRTMHTIKGGAGFLALTELEQLAHTAEDLLGKLRDGQRQFTSEIGTVLLATVDKCREGLKLVETMGNTSCLNPEVIIHHLKMSDVENMEQMTQPAGELSTAALAVKVTPAISASSTAPSTAHNVTPSAASMTDMTTAEKPIASESTIRVDVDLLDKLMTRVGELVLARNQILQFSNSLEDTAFISTAQRLNLITTELQESVMKTRMQPIGTVWAKFPRVVRDLSAQLGKQVRIEMEGKETELDKTIIESIKDPLTHLIRNSVDHGIEKADLRRSIGKPAEGCLTLRAYHEGGQVNIEICDDGAGLNFERIRQKAVERGLITGDQAARMSDREASQLILLPGFSTAEQVTSISGRGVGMDVVKTNIECIGGTLDLQSQPGQGTTVKIKIPLTLAIIPALIVTCDGDRYAIPQVNLLELVRLEGEQARTRIEHIHGAPVYRLRGQLLPIVYLREQLRLQKVVEPDDRTVLNIVVLRADDRQFGLVVDAINDTEEIVVKPLSPQLKAIAAYSGTTIMGDGKVALILDVLGAAREAHVVTEQRDRALADRETATASNGVSRQTMLLLSVGERQVAIPIALVARLEEISPTSIERSDWQEVVQYRGEIMPLIRLAKLLNTSPKREALDKPLQVVVYNADGRNLGIVVDSVLDIADADTSSARECTSEELLGSIVVQDRVTDLLNVSSIIRRATQTHGNTELSQLAV